MPFVTIADLSVVAPKSENMGLIQKEWSVIGPPSFYEAGPGAEFIEEAFQGLGQEAIPVVPRPAALRPKRKLHGEEKMRHDLKTIALVAGLTIGGILLWLIGSALSK